MSDPQAEGSKPADAVGQWRELRDAYMDVWAQAMGEAVNSEAYSQLTGAMLESYLTASSPVRDAQKKAMLSALEQFNMPSRADFVRLAERLSNIELLLDDMATKVDQIHQLAMKGAAQPAPQAKAEAASAVHTQPTKPAKKGSK